MYIVHKEIKLAENNSLLLEEVNMFFIVRTTLGPEKAYGKFLTYSLAEKFFNKVYSSWKNKD